MKRILLLLVFLTWSVSAFAQGAFSIINGDPTQRQLKGMTVASGQKCFDILGLPITAHDFTYQVRAGSTAVSVALVTFTGSTDGTTASPTPITTGVSITGGTVHFTGVYTNLCVTITTLTGTGALVDVAYKGQIPSTVSGGGGGGAVTSADPSTFLATASGPVAENAAAGANKPVLIGVVDGSGNVHKVKGDSSGDVQVGVPDGLDVSQGGINDAAATAGGTGSVSAKLRLATSQLGTLTAGAFTDLCEGLAMTSKHYLSVGTTDKSQVKATAGTLCSIRARNAAVTASYLRCVNALSASTTVGTTAVIYDMILPPGGGFVDPKINLPFTTALTCYLVTGKAETDATSVVATDVSYTLEFQ